MYKLVRLQVIAALIGVACGALLSGLRGAASAAIGGFAYVLASSLFAWYMLRSSARGRPAGMVSLFLGEAAKVALVVATLVLAARYFTPLDWKSLIIGLGVTLQANILALFLVF
jgi:ATP synthase protein I